jgi:hypothetical protein
MLKFRVRPLHAMTRSHAYKQLKRAIDTGICPDDIEIMAMDWASGSGRRISEGQIDPDDLEQMRVFFNMIRKSDIRAENC